jgi:hypothetical protein
MKRVGLSAVLIGLAFITMASSHALDFKNICPNEPDNAFCRNIGKQVYNKFGHESLREKPFGRIIGVTWIKTGQVIGYSPPMPEAGLGEDIRRSPVDAYYYIIKDDGGYVFVRQCSEIRPGD